MILVNELQVRFLVSSFIFWLAFHHSFKIEIQIQRNGIYVRVGSCMVSNQSVLHLHNIISVIDITAGVAHQCGLSYWRSLKDDITG